MENPQLTNFYRGDSFVQSAAPQHVPQLSESHNFLTFLTIAQQNGFDFLSVTWDATSSHIGAGLTSVISPSVLNSEATIVFKRISFDQGCQEREYYALLAEIRTLSRPQIRSHPGILKLEGICWEIGVERESVRPVLIFEEAKHGNLHDYLVYGGGQDLCFRERLRICSDVTQALALMHSCRTCKPSVKVQAAQEFRHNSWRHQA